MPLMKNRNNLRQLLSEGYVVAPCIYDCLSARSAQLCGFKALMLSGCALAWSMVGMPDIGLLTVDELIEATTRITDSCPLPLIIDADEGYGESPLNTYRMTTRLIKAGAAGMTLDDSTGIRGYERVIVGGAHPIMDEEIWLAKIRAAKAAIDAQESDFLLIARTIVLRKQGIDAAIERCQRAMAAGADMTLVIGLNNLEDCKRIAAEVPGWKMYPDIATTNGKADVDVKDIVPLGFNLITMHYTEYGAMWGMMYYGMENFKNENTVFSDVHAMGGLTMKDRLDQLAMDYREWLRLEKACYEGKEDEKK
jgi:2-methylisocitrate lyase-like PEP mutase family enzyme